MNLDERSQKIEEYGHGYDLFAAALGINSAGGVEFQARAR